MKYKGAVYAKIGSKYIKCTESVADLENNIADLTTQLAKANSDKERLGELLKEVYESQIANCELCKEDGLTVTASLHQENADRIKRLLTDCGITL